MYPAAGLGLGLYVRFVPKVAPHQRPGHRESFVGGSESYGPVARAFEPYGESRGRRGQLGPADGPSGVGAKWPWGTPPR
jgi:hypothetical protein